MPVVRITHVYDVLGEECENTYHYFHPTILPTAAIVNQLLAAFDTLIVPAINALQVAPVANVMTKGYAYNLGYSIESAGIGNGTITGTSADMIPNDMGLIVKRIPGQTFLNDGGAAYDGNRPIRKSHICLGGCPKAIMDGTGFISSGFTGTRWADFIAAMGLTLGSTTPAGTWYHNVFGLPLAALPPTASFPAGKPARPAVVAPVSAISNGGFGDLKTRE